MLSDEEKYAINTLEYVNRWRTNEDKYTLKALEAIDTVLNLIEKQSKEIEELKKEYERVRAGRNWLSERISAQIATPELFDKLVEENYISKDKIKEILDDTQMPCRCRSALYLTFNLDK